MIHRFTQPAVIRETAARTLALLEEHPYGVLETDIKVSEDMRDILVKMRYVHIHRAPGLTPVWYITAAGSRVVTNWIKISEMNERATA